MGTLRADAAVARPSHHPLGLTPFPSSLAQVRAPPWRIPRTLLNRGRGGVEMPPRYHRDAAEIPSGSGAGAKGAGAMMGAEGGNAPLLPSTRYSRDTAEMPLLPSTRSVQAWRSLLLK